MKGKLKGVMPDLVLPDVLNYSTQFGESSLENPLPWDTIPSVNYAKLNLVQPYLDELRRRSSDRVATNQDFIYVRQDIDEFLKRQADKTASLNEREVIKEHEIHQVALDAHEQERVARKRSSVKAYEITVKNADQPGLLTQETNSVAGNSTVTNDTTNATQKVAGNDAIEFQRAEAARLDEVEHILEDYISLLSSNRILIAN